MAGVMAEMMTQMGKTNNDNYYGTVDDFYYGYPMMSAVVVVVAGTVDYL